MTKHAYREQGVPSVRLTGAFHLEMRPAVEVRLQRPRPSGGSVPEMYRGFLRKATRCSQPAQSPTFYRYTPTRTKMKELLMQERVGRFTSVDFHWYLDVYHGADYFRRWHRLRENSGTLLNSETIKYSIG